MSTVFRFKQFSIDQSGCAMKINTDGVLLGALAGVGSPENILDIGTGTGVIAMMLAQRFPDAEIDAVELDENAAATAKANFDNSPYAERLNLYAQSFAAFFNEKPAKQFNLIISNPPFYINSLESPGSGKRLAKHADADFFEALVSGIPAHLTINGALWLILPLDTAELVKVLAVNYGLYLQQVISIKSYPESESHRELIKFGLQQTNISRSEFVIYDAPKKYSGQYQTVLKDFFTIFP